MLAHAIILLGEKDANSWWSENEDVFNNPRFLTEKIVLAPHVIEHHMELNNFNDEPTIWAHMHPYWDSRFGLYIIYEDDEVIYVGRNMNIIRDYLKPIKIMISVWNKETIS